MEPPDEILRRADLLYKQQRYALAEEHLIKVLEQDRENSHALALLAACSGCLGNAEKAIELARQAIAVDPEDDYSYYLLAWYLPSTGKNREALEAAKSAVSLNTEPCNLAVLATCHLGLDQLDEALAAAQNALELDPSSKDALLTMALVRRARAEREEAEKVLQQCLAVHPDCGEAHEDLAWWLVSRRKTSQAAHHFKTALLIDPTVSTRRDGLAVTFRLDDDIFFAYTRAFLWWESRGFWMKLSTVAFFLPMFFYFAFAEDDERMRPELDFSPEDSA